MVIDLDALEAVLAKATQGTWQSNCSHIYGPDPERLLIAQCSYALGPKSDDLSAIVALHTAAPALIAEHRALLARVVELEGRLSSLLSPDGYWFADDREVGHFDLDEMLEDTPGDAIVAVVPWRELPIIFAASIITGEDTSEWRTFATEQAARAALEPKP